MLRGYRHRRPCGISSTPITGTRTRTRTKTRWRGNRFVLRTSLTNALAGLLTRTTIDERVDTSEQLSESIRCRAENSREDVRTRRDSISPPWRDVTKVLIAISRAGRRRGRWKCETGKCGTGIIGTKLQGWKKQDWKYRHHVTGGGKCGTGIIGNRKRMERHVWHNLVRLRWHRRRRRRSNRQRKRCSVSSRTAARPLWGLPRMSMSLSVPEIFAIKVWSFPKSHQILDGFRPPKF